MRLIQFAVLSAFTGMVDLLQGKHLHAHNTPESMNFERDEKINKFMNKKLLVFQSVWNPKLGLALDSKVDGGHDVATLVMKEFNIKDDLQKFTYDG